MTTQRFTMRLLAAAVLTGAVGGGAFAQAPADVDALLARQPVQAGVTVTVPAAAERGTLKAQPVEWPATQAGVKPKGVVLTDAAGKKVRQFIDTAGGDKFNLLSYYADGVESYREIDSNATGKPNQFRWLGVNGGKWGLDKNGDGVIDQWIVLSAEEATQELFAAVKGKDAARLAALLMTDEDAATLKLPAADAAAIKQKAAAAAAKLTATAAALKLTDKAKWAHAELTPPNTTPRDAAGTAEDLQRHKSVAVLVDTGDGKMQYFATGEMILVGRAWKLVDGPSMGAPSEGGDDPASPIPDSIKDIVAQLVGVKPPALGDQADAARYHLERAALLEKINDGVKVQGAEQVPWLKQMVDAYTAGVEAKPDDKGTMARLTAWKDAIVKTGAPEVKAYTVFRHDQAEHSVRLQAAGTKNEDVAKVQSWRQQSFEAFVDAYPTSADAAEAVLQLAVAAEYQPKDAEAAARKWYERLLKDYAASPQAAKAAGAVKRIGSEGKPFELAGSTFDGKAFSEKAVAGGPAVVYYWASWSGTAAEQLKELAKLQKDYAAKGLQVVTVCLDDEGTKGTAAAAIQASGLPGFHLYAAGGLDRSPLAAAYGIHMVPHVFLVAKDGTVANRNALYGPGLKEEIEKLVK